MSASTLWWILFVFFGCGYSAIMPGERLRFPLPTSESSQLQHPLSMLNFACNNACNTFSMETSPASEMYVNQFHCSGQTKGNAFTEALVHTSSNKQDQSEAWITYEVLIKCSVQASVDSMVFSTWIHSDNTQIAVGRLDNIATNWKFKPMTCLQDKINDSLVLMRPQIHKYEPLNLKFKISWMATSNATRVLEYAIFDCMSEQLHRERLQIVKVQNKVNHNHFRVKSLQKRATSMGVSGYLIVANRLYIHHISLDGSRMNVAVSGLKYAVAVDFHFRSNALYWSDSSQQAIMKSTLDGANINRVLDHGLNQPESLSVDWISNKLYWTDVRGGGIGVFDLVSHNYKHSLITTEANFSPRGLVVDPIMRALYWTEWDQTNARIRKASMDGRNMTILFQDDLRWPYGITMDFDNQILYWTDSYSDKIECGNIDGTGRRVVISSGLEDPFDLTLLGDTLYISDWNLRILATNRSGGQPLRTVYNTFCDSIQTFGVQIVAEERQLLAENPCDGNGGRRCSHLCLLSSVNSSGFSCVCPDGMALNNDGITCSQTSVTNQTVSTVMGSCQMAGYENCCRSGVCTGSLSLCFCDSDCYHYGDCCNDIEDTCSPQTDRGAYLLISNVLYIHRVSLDGLRMKTLDASTDMIKSVDYNYWTNHIYWSTSSSNGLWQSQLDGSGVTPILTDDVQTIDDIAVDWISNKLYWTDSGQISRIRVLDIASGYYTSIINTGTGTNPRAIIVDPTHSVLYWSDWGSVAKIETASMDGENRTAIIDTDLVWPSGLTIDYAQQTLYWTDNSRGRIESSNIDGSNRITISNQLIYQPFGISVYRSALYYADFISGINKLNVSRGSVRQTILNSLCEHASGIEVFSIEKQPTGTNPCQVGNGGCSHICLLSSVERSGFSCACPDDLSLDEDAQTCVSTSTPITTTQGPMIRQGTCIAAGYTGGCCTSGTCRGSPPTCSCDSTCHIFRDCCSDVPPSCQPAIDVLEFVSVPSNVTTTLDDDTQQQQSQFHCSVRASRVTNFQWTFAAATNHEGLSSLNGSPQQISNQVGSLDSKYSVVSSDYSSELIVTDVQFSDTGIYTCIASIGSRISPIESSAFHTVEVLPKLPEISGSYSFSVEEKIRLWCRVEAHPQPSLVWIIRSPITMKRIVPTTIASVVNSHITVNSGNPYSRSELTIDNVNSNDGGDYICAATANKYSLVRSSSHSITVTSTNECEISRSPCLNGGTCINNYGRYHCICPSGYNGRNCSQRISYSIKPFFNSMPLNEVTVELGHSTNLTCGATGYPTPTVQWYKDGVQILGENEPLLFISEVLPDDRGNYSCKATNSEGVIESGQTQISIQRILQYTAVLKCNETLNFSDSHEILMLIADSSFLNGHGIVYSIKYLEDHTNLSDSALLLTLLTMDNMPPYDIIRKLLVSELMEICSVVSLSRFDGCETNSHSELELGGLLEIPCPCHEYLWMLPNVMNQAAWRSCGGSYTNGSELLDTDFSQCITVTDQRTSNLCQAAMSLQGAHEYPYDIVESVLNTTSDQQLSSVADLALLAVIVELLTIEAITNPKVREAYLKIIDYFQGLDPHHLSKSQSLTNSSTRVLDSLEQFASAVSIIDINRNSTITEYTYLGYQSYGITLVDLDASTITSEYLGQTFSAKRRKNSVTKVTEWTMAVVDSLVEDDSISKSLATSLHLPKQFLNGCVSASSSGAIRVAYFVFSTSVLFQSMSNEEQVIGSVVTSAQLNCTYDQMLPPIRLMYKKSTEGNQKQSCASMSRGLWSTTICQESLEGGHGLIGCNCYQLSYFGLLFESIPVTISVWVYVAVVFSFLFLIILFVMIAITESRLFSKAERIVLFNIDLTLILNYFLFLLGVNITSIPVLCGINSGVLQFITLVFYCWLAAQPILTFCQVSQRSEALFIKCITVLSWILPLLIVGLTAAVWYKSYVVTYFCGVTDFPLWFGLILPVALIGSIHFFAIALLFYKLIVKNNRTASTTSSSPMNYHSKRLRAIILAVAVFFTFYSGFIFGLLSVNRRLSHYSKHFQAIYSILIMIQGPLLIAHIFCCSVRDAKQLRMYKLFCCLYYNDARIGNLSDISHHTSTTDSGTNSLSSAEMFKANNITTDMNPSYQTDIDKWKKNEFSMTRSEVYDTVKWSKNEFSMTRNVVYDTVK